MIKEAVGKIKEAFSKPGGAIQDLDELDFDIDVNDTAENLNKKFDRAVALATELHSKKIQRWDDDFKLLKGKHLELSCFKNRKQVDKYKSDTIMNMIFPGYRNIVGLMTDPKPEPTIWPAPSRDPEVFQKNQEHAEHLFEMIDQRWAEVAMELEIPILLFQGLTLADSFLKYYWDLYRDDVAVEIVSPYDLMIYPNVKIEEADFVIQTSKRSFTWLKSRYPDSLDEIKKANSNKKDDLFKLEELWTDSAMLVRVGKTMIEAKANPFFEFKSEEEQIAEREEKGVAGDFKPVKNYFAYPQKPYIQFSTFKTDNGTYSGVSQTEQLEKIQISFNQRKRQIDDNANSVGNAKMIYDGNLLPPTEAEKHSGRPGEKINIPGMADKPGKAVEFHSGQPLPNYIPEDMNHSQKIGDDILGQHEITRGAEGRTKTAGEAELLRQADQTVVRLLSRSLDVTLGKLVEGWVQLMKMFYDEPKHIRRLASEYTAFSRHEIDDGIKIEIKVGSTLPTDGAQQKDDAKIFANAQMIAPIDLFRIHKFPNPEKMAENLEAWRQLQAGPEAAGAPGQDQEAMIAQENEAMAQGQQVPTNDTDDHQLHMPGHMTYAQQLGDQATPEAQQAFVAHMQEHKGMMEAAGGQQGQMMPAAV